jgi:hypothetical protein
MSYDCSVLSTDSTCNLVFEAWFPSLFEVFVSVINIEDKKIMSYFDDMVVKYRNYCDTIFCQMEALELWWHH